MRMTNIIHQELEKSESKWVKISCGKIRIGVDKDTWVWLVCEDVPFIRRRS